MNLRIAVLLASVVVAGCGKSSEDGSSGSSSTSSSPSTPAAAGLRITLPPGVTLESAPRATPLDPAALSPLPTGTKLLSAALCEPHGLKVDAGMEMTWPLSEKRPPGTRLWIQVLDPASGEWCPTGRFATVDESGAEAVGRVDHFSSIGLSEDSGCLTEWVWLLAGWEGSLEALAKDVTEKYRGILEIPAGRGIEVPQWLDAGGEVSFEGVITEAGVALNEPVKVKHTHCLEAARAEFASRSAALQRAFVEAQKTWTVVVSKGDAASVSALWQAHLDLVRVLKQRSQSFRNTWGTAAWEKVKEQTYEATRDAATKTAERWAGVDKFTKNPLLQGERDKRIDAAAKTAFTEALDGLVGRPGTAEMQALADKLLAMADGLTMALAYDRNQGREGTFLNAEPTRSYRLAQQDLSAMAESGEFTPGIIAATLKLAGKKFATLGEFEAALREKLSLGDFDAYAPALTGLARFTEDPVVTPDYYALGGPMTEEIGGKRAAGLRGSYHCAFVLALFEPWLLQRKVAPMTWECKGDTYRMIGDWIPVFEGRETREHEFRYQSDGRDKVITATTGPPGDGNFPELRREYARYRAQIRTEGKRGQAAFNAVVAGAEGTPEERLRAFAAMRLLCSDVRKFLSEDADRALKMQGIELVSSRIGGFNPVQNKVGSFVTSLLQDKLKAILTAAADALAPDDVDKFAKTLDKTSARLALDLAPGADTGLAPPGMNARLAALLKLNPALPQACRKRDPNDVMLALDWNDKQGTSLRVRAVDVPADEKKMDAARETLAKLDDKWALVTATAGKHVWYTWFRIRFMHDLSAFVNPRVQDPPWGKYRLSVTLQIQGQKLSAERDFDGGGESIEKELRQRLADAPARLKRVFDEIEDGRNLCRRKIKEAEEEIDYRRKQLNDVDAETRVRLETEIAEFEANIRKRQSELRTLEPQDGETSGWVDMRKYHVREVYVEMAGAHRNLGEFAIAKKCLDEAKRWGQLPADDLSERAAVAWRERDFEANDDFWTRSGRRSDYRSLAENTVLYKNDLRLARRFWAKAQEDGAGDSLPNWLPPNDAELAE